MVVWMVTTTWAACLTPISRDDFLETLVDGDIAVLSLDAATLEAARRRAREQLPCLNEVLEPEDVAAWFRLEGIASFVAGDAAAAAPSFATARALTPDYQLPSALGLPAREVYDAALPFDAEPVELPKPASGWLAVDGLRASAGPGGRPFLLQWVDGPQVALSARVDPGDTLPAYPRHAAIPVPVVSTAPPPPEAPPPSRPGRLSVGLAAGGAVAAGGSLALGLLSNGYKQRFLDGTDPSTSAEGEALIRANRTTGVASLGLGAVAAGLVGGAVVVGRW